MAGERLSKEDFHQQMAPLGEVELRKVLWTVYWRGPAPVRERIEGLLNPRKAAAQAAEAAQPADASSVLARVKYFAELARSGAYLGRDRRVTPKERTRWRFEFKELAAGAVDSLRGEDHESAARASAIIIDLACEMLTYDYFRSEDPVEAAGFVVSDAAGLLWKTVLRRRGLVGLSDTAPAQLLRWEQAHGWTRTGFGRLSEREVTLGAVVADLLPAPDSWGMFAEKYLEALERVPGTAARGGRSGSERARALSSWHGLMFDHLLDTEYEAALEALTRHPHLAGPEQTFLGARLARHRGNLTSAREQIRRCRRSLPGHEGFIAFAEEIGA